MTRDTTHFKCPTCNNVLLVENLLMTTGGESFLCPACNHVFTSRADVREAVKEANKIKEDK